ncbi:MAG: hypothetical protein IIC67_06870 [Thaumarchaeota archaeon]|nr:hypothetical protein [Nitrososphaerota archaeon]
MTKKYRQYSRDLSDKELETLRKKYSNHLKKSKGGILSDKQRKRLLGYKKKEHGTPDSDFWWKIKHSIQDSIMDIQLLCDIASEEELKDIFGTKPTASDEYPITKVLLSLLPESRTFRMKPKEIEKLQKEQEWRKVILNELVLESLYWYFHSGLFETHVHTRLLAETMDAISWVADGDQHITIQDDIKLERWVS